MAEVGWGWLLLVSGQAKLANFIYNVVCLSLAAGDRVAKPSVSYCSGLIHPQLSLIVIHNKTHCAPQTDQSDTRAQSAKPPKLQQGIIVTVMPNQQTTSSRRLIVSQLKAVPHTLNNTTVLVPL